MEHIVGLHLKIFLNFLHRCYWTPSGKSRNLAWRGLAQDSSLKVQCCYRQGRLLVTLQSPRVPVAINQGFIGIPPSETVSNLFLLNWCSTFHEVIVNHANGSTFLEISKKDFRHIPIVWPSEAVMAAFDDHVRGIYGRIVSNERESRKLTAQRNALLPKLVSGYVQIK